MNWSESSKQYVNLSYQKKIFIYVQLETDGKKNEYRKISLTVFLKKE